MLFFGHVGVALGVSVLATGAVAAIRGSRTGRGKCHGSFGRSDDGRRLGRLSEFPRSWLAKLRSVLDIRLILIGSMLPDIIDKPLGQVLLRESLSSGRIFSHTLLFPAILGVAAWYQCRRSSKTWLLALVLGTSAHLVLDSMWLTPRVLFWPAYGLAFDRSDLSVWIPRMFQGLMEKPSVFVPEIIGVIVMVWFLWHLLRRRLLLAFLRRGEVAGRAQRPDDAWPGET